MQAHVIEEACSGKLTHESVERLCYLVGKSPLKILHTAAILQKSYREYTEGTNTELS